MSDSPLPQLVQDRIEKIRLKLVKFGKIHENSGSFQTASHSVSLYTSIGPEHSGKNVNQDAILAIQCEEWSSVAWACAIADGVSLSMYAEFGGRLATWASLASLLSTSPWKSNRKRAIVALDAARSEINELGNVLRNDSAEMKFKPSYLPEPAYQYILNRQTFLQTTLCLVWCNGRTIFIANVGDAGALKAAPRGQMTPLFFPNVEIQQVNAISPNCKLSIEIDNICRFACRKVTFVAFTDGVAKGLTEQPAFNDSLNFGLSPGLLSGSAETCVQELCKSTSAEAADNMTMLLVKPL